MKIEFQHDFVGPKTNTLHIFTGISVCLDHYKKIKNQSKSILVSSINKNQLQTIKINYNPFQLLKINKKINYNK